jgi:hypothetical protein
MSKQYLSLTMPVHTRDEMLAEWHKRLNNHEDWKNQSSQYSCLMSSAYYMLRVGMIDAFERFELVELLTGAYCHFAEEYPQEWMHPASDYDVYNQAASFVGYINGNRYFLGTPEKNFGPSHFFAQFSRDDPERRIRTAAYQNYGVIRDRYIYIFIYIYTETGQKLAIVERNRNFEDGIRQRLDDPDVYRALLDASILALESGDMPTFVALREKELFSIFTLCLSCCDRFDLCEDCTACSGRGFIEDPNCPNRILPGFAELEKSTTITAPQKSIIKN